MRRRTFATLFAILFATFASVESVDRCKSRIPPEKRILRSNIAVKALVTGLYPNDGSTSQIAQFWIQDVYKGEDKLASALGLPGTGPEAVFHLKDQ